VVFYGVSQYVLANTGAFYDDVISFCVSVSRCECHAVLRSVGVLFCPGKYAVVNSSVVISIISCVTCNCLCTTKHAV
jgi:hypothetical protein